MADINGLHHAGIVAGDLSLAIDAVRRLGFTVAPPVAPMLGTAAVGAANAHIHLDGGFLELVTPGGPLPPDTEMITLEVPAERLPAVRAAVDAAAARIGACLERFPGMHILVFDATDIDRVAARLDAVVLPVQRPVRVDGGTRMEPVRYLDLPGATEGRLGVAQNATGAAASPVHPNGATRLAGSTLCVADAALASVVDRYETYLGRPAGRDGTFDLGGATFTVTGESALTDGDRPPVLPGFAGCTVAVTDLAHTEEFLRAADVSYHRSEPGAIAVRVLGTTITFR